MGLWDDLTGWLRQGRDRAATEAAKAAARQAAESVMATVDEAGEEALGFAERELKAAEKAREGRPTYTPSRADADAIAAQVEAAAKASEESAAAARARPSPELDARAELERLKAEMKAKRDPK